MKTILVDPDKSMLRSFAHISSGIQGLDVVGRFETASEALEYAASNPVELAILETELPGMDGLTLTEKLRMLRSDMLIVFLTSSDQYIRASNLLGVDYYILKPCTRKVLEDMMARMRLLVKRQEKAAFVQTFGQFSVLKDGLPISLNGKPREILAAIAVRRGQEISNEALYSIVWEGRPYSNIEMKVYYNALRRLKDALAAAELSNLMISTTRGQLLNTAIVDCDFFAWLDKAPAKRESLKGTFLPEYRWSESFLAGFPAKK